jgi:hypothetical protein
MPTLAASFNVNSAAADTTALTTSSFTPATGDIIVVKGVVADNFAMAAPSDTQGNTYTQRALSSLGSNVWAAIWTATASSATSMTVSTGTVGAAQWHSTTVERWSGAALAGTPATNGTKTGTGAPATTLTSTGTGSVVTWLNGDWAAVSPAGRTYNTTSATPTEDGIHDKSTGFYVAEYAWQAAASPGTQTFGLTAPTGETWTLLGIEILASGGPAPDSNQYRPIVPWRQNRGWRVRANFLSTFELFASRDVATVLTPAAMPVLTAPMAPAGRGSAPAAILFRSSADPVAALDAVPDQLVARGPAAPTSAPVPILTASRVETVALESPTLLSPAAAILARPASTPLLLRSTADPAPTSDTPPVPLALRVTSSAPPTAPVPSVLVSRDVTPLQPSSNPAAPILGRAPWSTTAPPAVLSRSTADPTATDSPPRPMLARAGSIALTAPFPALAGSRDVTPLQPSESPPAAVLGRALWSTTAPQSLLIRSTADVVDLPPAPRPVTAAAVRVPDLARVLTWRQMPPAAVERRTDGVLQVAPQRPPGAARAWLLTPRAEPSLVALGGTLAVADRPLATIAVADRTTSTLAATDRTAAALTTSDRSATSLTGGDRPTTTLTEGAT